MRLDDSRRLMRVTTRWRQPVAASRPREPMTALLFRIVFVHLRTSWQATRAK